MAAATPVGLLVVHGIGSQRRGRSLAGVVDGLRSGYGDAMTVIGRDEAHVRIEGLGPRPVEAFEVYWAELLEGDVVRGTFDFDRVLEVVWFPWLNHRGGLLPPEVASRRRVTWWTAILAPLGAVLFATYSGARTLAGFLGSPDDAPPGPRPSLRQIWATRGDHRPAQSSRTRLDALLDRVAADVFTYANGIGQAFPDGTDREGALAARVVQIRGRFEDAAARAVAAGCDEIQVVAHSLGTVVAFTTMCAPGARAGAAPAPARLTHLHTIGSPLEKFRFFWTRLVAGSDEGPVVAVGGRLLADGAPGPGVEPMRWDNFFSRLDLVSGSLGAFPGWPRPRNHPVPGLGGLMSSHTAYDGNPAFLTHLGEGLGAGPPAFARRSRLAQALRALGAAAQNVALPAAVLALAVIGAGLLLAVGWLMGWVLARPFDLIGLDGAAEAIPRWFAITLLVGGLLGQIVSGRSRARDLHRRYWAGAGPLERSAGPAASPAGAAATAGHDPAPTARRTP